VPASTVHWIAHLSLFLLLLNYSNSWEYNVVGDIGLEDFEASRGPRRCMGQMVLPRSVRQCILKKEWDVPQRDIAQSVRRNIRVKNQRIATINNLDKTTRLEEILESAGRKIKRALRFQKPVSEQVKDLESKVNEANRIREQQLLELCMAEEAAGAAAEEEAVTTTSSRSL
jgi:hypothetical protein